MKTQPEINSAAEVISSPRLDKYDVPKLIKEFKENGVITLREWLTQDEVVELSCNASPHFARTKTGIKFSGILKNIDKVDDWFHQKFNHGTQVPLIEQLLGTKVVPASAGVFVKRPNEDKNTVDPHRDASALSDKPLGATMWLAIDPAGEHNGSVNFLKGSHLREMDPETATEDEIYRADLQPGDATIHNAQILHWSNGNQSSDYRRAVTYFYFTRHSPMYGKFHSKKKP